MNKKYNFFHPSEINIHCKNYFGHICDNLNKLITSGSAIHDPESCNNLIKDIINFIESGHYIDATQNVLKMLQETKSLLESNSKSKWPK